MKKNEELLVLQEGLQIGIPVWHFADSRDELPHVYAPAILPHVGPNSNPPPIGKSVCENAERWGDVTLDLEDPIEYVLYTPYTLKEFNWLCMATMRRGGCLELITPRPLRQEQLSTIAPVFLDDSINSINFRPVSYLLQGDVCQKLDMPWIYILRLYSWFPDNSVVVCSTEQMKTRVLEFAKSVDDCYVFELKDVLKAEEKEYRDFQKNFLGRKPGKKGGRNHF